MTINLSAGTSRFLAVLLFGVGWGCGAPAGEPPPDAGTTDSFVDEGFTIREYEPEYFTPEELADYYAVQAENLVRFPLPPDTSAPARAPTGLRKPTTTTEPAAAGTTVVLAGTEAVTLADITAAENEAAEKYVDISNVTDIFQVMRTLSRKYDVPYEMIYMMAYQESGFRQFKNWNPSHPLVSGDGGYGMMQVTPSVLSAAFRAAIDMARLQRNPAYNLEVGVHLMRDKWDAISKMDKWPIGLVPDPENLESWYWVVASYNGLSAINNPNSYVAGPQTWTVRGFTFTRSEAYQDAVWRWIDLRFGLPLSKIPAAEIAPARQRPEKKVYTLPTPTHAMTFTEKESMASTLRFVTYPVANPDGRLEVELTGGGSYVFTGVPPETYYDLMLAEAQENTKDAYFVRSIFNTYPRTEN